MKMEYHSGEEGDWLLCVEGAGLNKNKERMRLEGGVGQGKVRTNLSKDNVWVKERI